MRAVSGAQSALKELSKLLPDTAEVMLKRQSGNCFSVRVEKKRFSVG